MNGLFGMFLKILIIYEFVIDFGYLFCKNFVNLFCVDFVFGEVVMFYFVVICLECEVVLMLDVDFVVFVCGWMGGLGEFFLDYYVNDCFYVVFLFLSVVMVCVFWDVMVGCVFECLDFVEMLILF